MENLEQDELDPGIEIEGSEHQSCFLPGTKIQFAWDSTSLGYFKACPRLYYYQMIEGWASRFESVHLRFGREFHQALQEYDMSRANGVKHEDAIHDIIRELVHRTVDYSPDPNTKAGKYKSRNNLVSLVIDYLDHFAHDTATTVIMENGRPAVELSFRFELDFGPTDDVQYVLCGHMDRVVEFNGDRFVMDRKTSTSTLSSNYFNQYEPHNQMSLYTLAGGVVLGTEIKGIIIDAAQILLDSPNRFVRGFSYRTGDQLDEWLRSLEFTLAYAKSCAENEFWPMNDTACDRFGGCPFRAICSKSPDVRSKFLPSMFSQQPEEERWNPLRPR